MNNKYANNWLAQTLGAMKDQVEETGDVIRDLASDDSHRESPEDRIRDAVNEIERRDRR